MSDARSIFPRLGGILIVSTRFPCLEAASISDQHEGFEIPSMLVIAAVLTSLLILVFILTLCGGCTPMEVGSDAHEAAGGQKSNNMPQYSGVATDVNTRVMQSGTTLPNDPYRHEDMQLPYAIHPQTAQTFTGYGSQDQGQNLNQGQGQGYGQAQGFGDQQQHSYEAHGTSTHRHVSETGAEPPPPSYEDTLRASHEFIHCV
ncbi:hypothetical protein MAR_012136 [Mya arenaria]|uniref:Uncharacterized protein n=1 Tax=Mya arenaria TaxID=6604 RepID=A0ABY7FXQ5_MYAAR|nr:hypothetical protein MAR_012136 [Mya arenaria]